MERLRDYTQELKDKQNRRTTARLFHCLAVGDNRSAFAAQYATTRKHWADRDQVHQILLAAVGAQTQASDPSFIGVRSNEVFSVVRPRTIIGRLPELQRVGFDAALTGMSGGTSAQWVGGGAPVPFSKPTFSRLATPLGRLKIAAMCAEELELVKSADPDAELIVSNDFVGACVQASDTGFIDPSIAAVAHVRPASITNGAPAFASSGSTALLIDADLGRLVESLIARGSNLLAAYWVLHPVTAAFLARVRNVNGDYAFPNVTVLGGTLMGLPVIVSAAVPHVGSPSVSSVVLLDAARIWLAEDPAMELAVAKSATVEFLDNPSNNINTPTPTTMVSAFQSGAVILRGVQAINWKIADPGFAAVLNGLAD